MKKILLGSSALIAAAALVAPANAASKIKLGIGGFTQFFIADYNISGQDNSQQPFVLGNNSEIHFRGQTTLDNGLQVGVAFELEYSDGSASGAPTFKSSNPNGTEFDEGVIWIGGGFGRLYLGEDDTAEFRTNIGTGLLGVGVSPINGAVPGLQRASTAGSILNGWNTSLTAGHLGDSANLTYMTPRINGFQAGVTYTPDSQNFDNDILDEQIQVNTDVDSVADNISVGANYRGKFNGLGFGISGGYYTSSNNVPGGVDEAKGWRAALTLGFGGFTLTGAYADRDNYDNGPTGALMTDFDNQAWAASIQYKMGPWKLMGLYGESEDETRSTGVVTEDAQAWGVGVTYSLGAGIATSLAYWEVEDAIANTDLDIVIAGFGVSF